MTYYIELKTIRTALITKIQSVIAKVFYGDLHNIGTIRDTEYAIVVLKSDTVANDTFRSTTHEARFIVYIVNRTVKTDVGNDRIEQLVGNVFDVIAADRSMNHSAIDTTISSIEYAPMVQKNIIYLMSKLNIDIKFKM